MSIFKSTAYVLRLFVTAGILLMIIGLIFSKQRYGEELVWISILVLVCAPLAGIITTTSSFVSEKDWFWVKISLLLIAILTIGIIVSIIT